MGELLPPTGFVGAKTRMFKYIHVFNEEITLYQDVKRRKVNVA